MRWIVVCLLVAAGFWYYTGQTQPGATAGTADYLMQDCMAKARYAASRMAGTDAGAQQECADRHNLYHENGHWYRY